MQAGCAVYVAVCFAFVACSSAQQSTTNGENEAGSSQAGAGGAGQGGEGDTAGAAGLPNDTNGGRGGSAAGGAPAGSGGAAAGGGAAANAGGTAGKAATGGTSGAPGSDCGKLADCDTFESYTPGSRPGGPWTGFETTNGSVTVDETRAFRGSKRSVKISINPAAEMTARMRHAGTGLLPADEIFMRMMVWMDAPPRGSGHWNWMWGEGTVTQKSGGKLINAFIASGGSLSGGTWMLYGGSANNGFQDCFAQASTAFPVGRWVCYEAHFNGKSNSAETWIDGKRDELLSVEDAQPLTGQCVPGFNYTNNLWYIPRIEKAFFGFKVYHTLNASATAWIDDVAISTTRIGCP
ncbi:MAG: hypothetical protein SF187_27710 [Deltaproteobacteria bacterium]|nr:hypothetical protein [Deltaproteobacteria bacterium]